MDVVEAMKQLVGENMNIDEFTFTPHGLEIIEKISNYAEQREIFKREYEKGKEIFKDGTAKQIFSYLCNRIVSAPTPIFAHISIILIMPFFREKLQKEENNK